MDDYWEQIELTQAMLRLQAPTTAQGVIDVLKTYDPQATSFSGDAFSVSYTHLTLPTNREV